MLVGARAVLGTAFKGMFANRMRAFLCTLGIAIGVATLMAILALVNGLNKTVTDQLAQLGANTFYITNRPWMMRGNWWQFRNRPNVTLADVKALRAGAPMLTTVSPMGFAQTDVNYLGESMAQVTVRGTNDEFIEASSMKIDAGRFLSSIDVDLDEAVVVIGSEVKSRLFHQADPIGAKIVVGEQRYRVIGTLKEQGKSFGQSQDTLVIIPVGRFGEQFGKKRSLVVVATAPVDHLVEAEDQIVETMRRTRGLAAGEDDNFAINRSAEMIRIFNEQTALLFAVAILVGAITLLVGGIGVMNIMLVAVTERTREVGVRRALGARRRTILLQFLTESVLVTLLGGALGTALGIFGMQILSQISPVPASASLGVALGGLVFSAVVGAIFGVWPAYRAAALDPIESLRYE
jgi:putative ABC transport system permease protein